VKNIGKFFGPPEVKYSFHNASFHTSHDHLMALYEDLPYQISPKLVKEYGKYRYKSKIQLSQIYSLV
jgi:hypothetical protein